MPKNPYNVLKELSKGQFDRNKALLEFGHSQSDSFITWIIGFGVAAISLLVANLEALHRNGHGSAKPLIVLLTLSICSGLIYRSLSYHMIILYKKLEDYFAGVFADIDMSPIEPDPDIHSASFDEVIRRLNDDFEEAIPYSNPLTDDQKAIEIPRLRQHYIDLCNHSKKLFDLAIDHWADVNQTAFKISKEKFKKQASNPHIGFRLRLWAAFASVLYFICILTFMAAVIVTTFFLFHAV
jgi:hypothetical protein